MMNTPAARRFLYSTWYRCWDACYGHPKGEGCYEVWLWPITRVTKQRIYFRYPLDRAKYMRESIHEFFIDRAEVESDGSAYSLAARDMLYLEPPDLDYRQGVIEDGTLSELRRQAADAHPDRGGDPTEFRVAYARYLAAKKRAS